MPVFHCNCWLNLLIVKVEMVASKLAESQKAEVCSESQKAEVCSEQRYLC